MAREKAAKSLQFVDAKTGLVLEQAVDLLRYPDLERVLVYCKPKIIKINTREAELSKAFKLMVV